MTARTLWPRFNWIVSLIILEGYKGPVHLLLTDIIIEDINGIDLFVRGP
jgi:hypothetical protein